MRSSKVDGHSPTGGKLDDRGQHPIVEDCRRRAGLTSLVGETNGSVGYPLAAVGLDGRASYVNDTGELGGRVVFLLVQKGYAPKCLRSLEEELNNLSER